MNAFYIFVYRVILATITLFIQIFDCFNIIVIILTIVFINQLKCYNTMQ